jgi:hypothetical protein
MHRTSARYLAPLAIMAAAATVTLFAVDIHRFAGRTTTTIVRTSAPVRRPPPARVPHRGDPVTHRRASHRRAPAHRPAHAAAHRAARPPADARSRPSAHPAPSGSSPLSSGLQQAINLLPHLPSKAKGSSGTRANPPRKAPAHHASRPSHAQRRSRTRR